jgi:predicted O-methyltransferase YrrM
MAVLSWELFDHLVGALPIELPRGRITGGRDLEVLLRLAHQFAPRRVLELYTSFGDTALALAKTCPEAEVVTADITVEMAVASTKYNQAVEILPASRVGEAFHGAPEAARIRQVLCNPQELDFSTLGRFDLVYVDGNHEYDHVRFDTRAALSVIRAPGVIVWDDYWSSCPDVQRFIDHLNRSSDDSIFLVQKSRVCFCLVTPERIRALTEAAAKS